ncbi:MULTISPECIES: cell envelope biogenesis protein TolA [unclassified Sphingomonas]|jgi:outer membrane biosynthesis protein TonB|uniref:cell envelope biogenesis protein TolA n=1 Tax=unclassified Sphingomonas TaxID=196159 RepID=UPI000E1069A5|nr:MULTISPECIES: cell envelope biogenesis protein TolA [unclassified Sphingomonas]AXJ94979.1 cell envelope biogenesis protein TolA [Sphingomonas sp. FARSPH]
MDRAEKIGLAVAVAGHVVLFGLLSVGFLSTPNPEKLKATPIEISLVKDVALEATAPQSVTPPAQSKAPDAGDPEDAAPPAAAEPELAAEPEPAPPEPKPAPPKPAPKPEPKPEPKPAPAKPQPKPKPAPVKPEPKPRPEPKVEEAAPAKPTHKPEKPAAAKHSEAKPTERPAPAKAAAKPQAAAKPSAGRGSDEASKATRPRGSRLGNDFLKGLSSDPSPSTSTAPKAAKIDARAMAGIVAAIQRQIQPCADRQGSPGPGANEIVTTLNLRLNEDGTLAGAPRLVRQTGVTDENERYKQRVFEIGIAAFKGCSPLKLPAEYYDTPSGGWNNINFQWKLK